MITNKKLWASALLLATLMAGLGSHAVGQENGAAGGAKPAVAILIFDGVQVIDFTGPYEVLNWAIKDGGQAFDVYTVAEKPEAITTAMGLTVTPKYSFANAPRPDILVIPGGGHHKPGARGVGAQLSNPNVMKWVQDNAKDARVVMSVCNGAFILAQANLLDGLRATTTSGAIQALKAAAPKAEVVRDKRFVDNGKIITTAGLSSGLDGALHVIEKLLGKGAAQFAARGIEYDWNPASGYAAAALADRHLLPVLSPIFGGLKGNPLLLQGDTDRYELRVAVGGDLSAKDILARIDTTLAKNNKWKKVESQPLRGKDGSRWQFTDEEGHEWGGELSVESAPGTEKGLVVSAKIARRGARARARR